VNVDYVGRDGERDMHELVSRLVTNVTLPLMLDSTEWQKMEAGLKVAGGKCILNSTNYEDGDERFFQGAGAGQAYGAGVVVGTIDEDGMARTAEKKFQIAQRAYRDAWNTAFRPGNCSSTPWRCPSQPGLKKTG
jgi:5-methyltetrahydrofolate--homocysteine methyltransferase